MPTPTMHMPRALILVAAIAALLVAHDARAQRAPLPPPLVALDAPEGERLFAACDARADFFPLAEQFVSQQQPSYCGVASSVVVLNALGVPAPEPPAFGAYRAFTQDNVFNARARHVAPPEAVLNGGLTLDQLGGILASHPARARVVHASDSSVDEFRRLASDNLRTSGNFVIVNYDRAAVGQPGGGHISPLGAYNASADRFLLMDVARYKYPPTWIPTDLLFAAMNTTDPVSSRSRGFVLVEPAPSPSSPLGPPASGRVMRFGARVVALGFAAGLLVGALAAMLVARSRWRRPTT